MSREDTTELRFDVPNELINVLDAISLAQRITRNQLAVRVLLEFSNARVHEANVIQSVLRVHPTLSEDGGKGRA